MLHQAAARARRVPRRFSETRQRLKSRGGLRRAGRGTRKPMCFSQDRILRCAHALVSRRISGVFTASGFPSHQKTTATHRTGGSLPFVCVKTRQRPKSRQQGEVIINYQLLQPHRLLSLNQRSIVDSLRLNGKLCPVEAFAQFVVGIVSQPLRIARIPQYFQNPPSEGIAVPPPRHDPSFGMPDYFG